MKQRSSKIKTATLTKQWDGASTAMNHKYILSPEGEAVPVDDILVWGKWFESEEGRKARRVAWTEVDNIHVSTAFIGLDHSFGSGPIQIFETMVFQNIVNKDKFGDKEFNYHPSVDDFTERYATMEEAKAGHARIVEEAKKGVWKCEICSDLRADKYISVLTYPLSNLPGGERNLKYCNDNSKCELETQAKALTGKM